MYDTSFIAGEATYLTQLSEPEVEESKENILIKFIWGLILHVGGCVFGSESTAADRKLQLAYGGFKKWNFTAGFWLN